MNVIRVGESQRMGNVRVRLVRKLAERIDGVDLSRRSAGQVFSLPADQARLLIAEQWAELFNQTPVHDANIERSARFAAAPAVWAATSGKRVANCELAPFENERSRAGVETFNQRQTLNS
jgi:hypothetical protein